MDRRSFSQLLGGSLLTTGLSTMEANAQSKKRIRQHLV